MKYRYQICALITLALLVFLTLGPRPQYDLMISAWFYDGQWLGQNSPWQPLREVYYRGSHLVLLWGLLLTIYAYFRPSEISIKIYGFFLGLGVVGPLLLVNSLLKEFWGRARPRHIIEFGGDKEFTAVQIWPVDQCDHNCSFVSGEASGAMILMLMGWFLWSHRRWTRYGIVLLFLPMALMRIIAGAHFASDVILAMVFNLLVFYGLLNLLGWPASALETQRGAFWRDSWAMIKTPWVWIRSKRG